MTSLAADDVYALAPYAKTLGVVFDEMTAAGVRARWRTISRSPRWAVVCTAER
ncbi:hypothetical protein [Streptomyces griseorubiginosus]|uniref:hypothetical protein n=1 Tax=Streptomyces griseorubiginosus TaxID=67304 RepID=UPI0036655BAB